MFRTCVTTQNVMSYIGPSVSSTSKFSTVARYSYIFGRNYGGNSSGRASTAWSSYQILLKSVSSFESFYGTHKDIVIASIYRNETGVIRFLRRNWIFTCVLYNLVKRF
jgi:hypothetical protein